MGEWRFRLYRRNHLIHSARRNIDITAIIINNQIYGMTGGQSSPTTPFGLHTSSSPFGHLEHPFDISRLVRPPRAVRGAVVVYTPDCSSTSSARR
jgi:2-oxoglutarate ferredoxin oxidoreductase subunit beta